MLTGGRPAGTPCVVDNMVLAMFVDADRVPLLLALAGGSVYVTPSILDSHEAPPFGSPPLVEFARGLYHAQQRLSQPFYATRAQRRTAFYQAGQSWQLVTLSPAELQLASNFAAPATRRAARASDPSSRPNGWTPARPSVPPSP